jgi:hypothetical protein
VQSASCPAEGAGLIPLGRDLFPGVVDAGIVFAGSGDSVIVTSPVSGVTFTPVLPPLPPQAKASHDLIARTEMASIQGALYPLVSIETYLLY